MKAGGGSLKAENKMAEKGIVIGAGFLGTRIARNLGYTLIGREALDVTNANAISDCLGKERPEVVINAVGKTGGPEAIGIDWCENHKRETLESNVLAAVNLALEATRREIYLVHLGSGCIYTGDNNGKGYSEDDPPNFGEKQFYARTKILAEQCLREFPNVLILRLRMPIDDRPHQRNLIDKLVEYSQVIDIQNSMTTVPHMLNAMRVLIERRAYGIYNFVNPGTTSAKEIMEMYQQIVNPDHVFGVFSLEKMHARTKAERSNCCLSPSKLQEVLHDTGAEMPEIHEALRECLTRYKQNSQTKT